MPEDDLCDCPLLKFHAQTERMASQGIISDGGDNSVSSRVNAITIGILRQENGCAGPRFNTCRYYYSAHGSNLMIDPNVPLLKRKIDDGQDHKYL